MQYENRDVDRKMMNEQEAYFLLDIGTSAGKPLEYTSLDVVIEAYVTGRTQYGTRPAILARKLNVRFVPQLSENKEGVSVQAKTSESLTERTNGLPYYLIAEGREESSSGYGYSNHTVTEFRELKFLLQALIASNLKGKKCTIAKGLEIKIGSPG